MTIGILNSNLMNQKILFCAVVVVVIGCLETYKDLKRIDITSITKDEHRELRDEICNWAAKKHISTVL